MKVSKQRSAGLLVKSFLMGTLAIAISVSPVLQNKAKGDSHGEGTVNISDPSDGVRKSRGKSVSLRRGDPIGDGAVQLTDGIRKSNGRFNSKFSQRTLQFQRNLVLDQIEMALELGEFEMAQDLLEDLYQLNRVGR